MSKIVIGPSRNGRGIISQTSFSPNEIIFKVTGSFLTCSEDESSDKHTRANTIRFDKDRYINPRGEIGDFLNHSCNPNAAIIKKSDTLFIVAIKNIGEEEVVIDYSTIIAPDDSWVMECKCGSENCRKKIGKFELLPDFLKQKYITLHMVPDYILK